MDNRREFSRIPYESPIHYSGVQIGEFEFSRMFNYSKGGLYFESFREFAIGNDVQVIMDNYTPGTFGPEAYQTYMGKIRWCREIPKTELPRFGIGIEFMEKSHELMGAETADITKACELCGTLTPISETKTTPESIQLCCHCYKHFSLLPAGGIKASVQRFLMGNVV